MTDFAKAVGQSTHAVGGARTRTASARYADNRTEPTAMTDEDITPLKSTLITATVFVGAAAVAVALLFQAIA